jgi:hypothetical protein
MRSPLRSARALVAGLLLCATALPSCSWEQRGVKHLSEEEFSAYYALKPFMSDDQRKEYLKLKTEDERTNWLKSHKFYDMFYKYDDHIREQIVAGAVQNGWSKDMVLMSWGAPFDKRALAGRPAARSEMLVYRFEKHDDGSILVYVPGSKTEYKATDRFRRLVYLDNDVVTEIVQKEGWED